MPRLAVTALLAWLIVAPNAFAHNAVPATPGVTSTWDAGAEWPQSYGNAARTGTIQGAGPVTAPQVRWQFAPTIGGGSVSPIGPPLVVGGIAYAAEPIQGRLIAFDAAMGQQRWQADIGVQTTLDPTLAAAVAGGTIYVAGSFGAATGRERWHYAFGEQVIPTAPAVVGDTIYASGPYFTETLVVALELATGAERWRMPSDGRYLSVAEGMLFIAGSDLLAFGEAP
jgi:outer membrane protein assembly factor BamB